MTMEEPLPETIQAMTDDIAHADILVRLEVALRDAAEDHPPRLRDLHLFGEAADDITRLRRLVGQLQAFGDRLSSALDPDDYVPNDALDSLRLEWDEFTSRLDG